MAELGKSQPGLPHVVSCVHIRAVCDKKLDNRVCTLEHSRVHSGLAQGILGIDVDTQLHTEFDGFEGVGLRHAVSPPPCVSSGHHEGSGSSSSTSRRVGAGSHQRLHDLYVGSHCGKQKWRD